MRVQHRIAAAKWASSALHSTLRGEKVELPKRAPKYAGDLIEAARLSFGCHLTPERRREVATVVEPMFSPAIIQHAIYLAAERRPPLRLTPEPSLFEVRHGPRFRMAMTGALATNLLKGVLFDIAGIGRDEQVSQTMRQRAARRGRRARQTITVPARRRARANANVRFCLKITSPFGWLLRLMHRLPR